MKRGGQLNYVGHMLQDVKARCGMAKAALILGIIDGRYFPTNTCRSNTGQLLQCLTYSVSAHFEAYKTYNFELGPSGLYLHFMFDFFGRDWTHRHTLDTPQPCWPLLKGSAMQIKSARSRVLGLVRRFGNVFSAGISACGEVGALRRYATALPRSPDCLLLLLAVERSWINQIDEAVRWMWSQHHNSVSCWNFLDVMNSWANRKSPRGGVGLRGLNNMPFCDVATRWWLRNGTLGFTRR